MKTKLHPIHPAILAVALLLLALAPAARATVTNLAYWRLGENDPGAVNGGAASSTTNLLGGALNLVGSPAYTNDVSTVAAAQVGSTLGLRFGGSNYGTNALVSTLTNNFGLELWVRPDSASGTQCLGYNGNSGVNGWGLYIHGGQFKGLFGGVSLFAVTGAPVTANVWTHVALVRDNGTNVLYVNGAPVFTNTVNPNVPSGRLAVAVQPQTLGAEFFAGALDEVRVFTFAPGAFNPNELLYFNGQLPAATTTAATSVGTTTATLTGTVNPGNLATATWFEWGTTTNYGNFTATNTLAVTNVTLAVSNTLTSLTPGTTYHYRAVASNVLGVSHGTNVSFTTATFANVPIAGLPGVRYSSVAWGDYDNDGRLDILLTGLSNVVGVSQIWRNTGNGFTNVTASVTPGLPGVSLSSVAWGDYDNDGRLDFLFTGTPTGLSGISQLWRNTGSGFTNVTSSLAPGLPGVRYSSVAWGDYDNDGRLDFLLTGLSGPDEVSQLWRNTGSGFTNVTASVAPGLPGVNDSSVAWGDYDNDGRLDFLLTGFTGSASVSQLWRNTGSGFTNVTASVAPGLPGVNDSSVAWGDYDNDGRLDFLLTGYSGVSQLWQNTGSGFSNVTASVAPGLPGVSFSSVAWGDYDNDGRLDFLLTGSGVSQLWRNTGSGFTNVTSSVAPGLPGVQNSAVAWGDYDNDGRLDFLLTGTNVSQLRRNDVPALNTAPTTPTGLTATPTTNGVLLSWNAAADAQTPASGLSYNVRAGTTPGGTNLLAAHVNATSGFRRVPALGNAQMNLSLRLTLTGVPLGQKIYWSVQAIDTAFAGGAFATESAFTNGFALVSVPGLPAGSRVAWGDYDNDGLLDVFTTGGSGVSQLWRNTGSTFTNVPIAGLPALFESAVAWGDYDNDGRLDFILTGTDGSVETAVSQLWRNTGSGFTNVTATQFTGLPGMISATAAWGDYDNDGRLDLALGGLFDDGNGGAPVSQLWRNTGSNFVNVTSLAPGLPGSYAGTLAWADYDNDGWLDLFVTGHDVSRLYRNTGSGFTNVTATTMPGLPGLSVASAAWGDYDNDGRPDLIFTGALSNNFTFPISQLWRNTGGTFNNVPIAGLPAVSGGSVQWGDYDADGRLDFLLNGQLADGFTSTNQLWRNTDTGFVLVPFTGLAAVGYGQSAWADYDNDGKLDFLTTGDAGAQLWRNLLPQNNTPPSAPTGLAMTASLNAVMLSWNSATDAQTPSSGLSYNVRAGSTPGGTNLLAAHVNAANGFRRLPARGNAEQRHFLPLLGVTNGQTVYWSVQAVDTSYAGGPFATETSVVSDPVLNIAPATSTNALLYWTPPTFGWLLQTSPDLAPAAWSNAPSGGQNPVLVPLTNGLQKTFYRLSQ